MVQPVIFCFCFTLTDEGADVKGIPSFWLTVFKNVDMLSEMIQVGFMYNACMYQYFPWRKCVFTIVCLSPDANFVSAAPFI